MGVLMIIYGAVLSSTRFGRRIYMVGDNANAARMHMGSPSAIGGTDLDAITAAVLGGVAFTGGGGNMLGVFIGVMLLTCFQNRLVVVGLDSFYQIVAKGLLLIAALTLDFYRERARIKATKAQ